MCPPFFEWWGTIVRLLNFEELIYPLYFLLGTKMGFYSNFKFIRTSLGVKVMHCFMVITAEHILHVSFNILLCMYISMVLSSCSILRIRLEHISTNFCIFIHVDLHCYTTLLSIVLTAIKIIVVNVITFTLRIDWNLSIAIGWDLDGC